MNKILEDAREQLSNNGIDPTAADYLYQAIKEKKGSLNDFNTGIQEILKGKPVQYVVGNVNFFGNIIDVNEGVLIPRFETELLVEKIIKRYKNVSRKLDILDIGTGSGCIAITLKKELDANVDAIDISDAALKTTRENALKNDVKITIYKSNILRNVSRKFDIIVSNPPYIAEDEKIENVVKNNEPHLALYAKNNGLYYYEEILKTCKPNLKTKFFIAFEIGYKQKEAIIDLVYKYLGDVNVECEKDLSGKDRFIFVSSK